VEIGNKVGPDKFQAQGSSAEADFSVSGGFTAHAPQSQSAQPEAGVATATARTSHNQAYLSTWVAADPRSARVLAEAQQAAFASGPVLIHGEPGSGKKLLAAIIHDLTDPAAPIVHFSPECVPPHLIETELFGHESAGNAQRGRLELAHGGTLVIEELAAVPPPAQATLLRVIDQQSFRRPGGTRSVSASVRIIALTALAPAVARDRAAISPDLLERFASVVEVPNLAARPADIPALAARFAHAHAAIHRTSSRVLSPEALELLQSLAFPGNVAELRRVVEYAAAHSEGAEITPAAFPVMPQSTDKEAPGKSLETVEREHITRILEFTKGRKTHAATILGISRKTLLEKRKRYGLG
jgi:DNA-binding NtrC family response regulator